MNCYYYIRYGYESTGHMYVDTSTGSFCRVCGRKDSIHGTYQRISINAVRCCACNEILFNDFNSDYQKNKIVHKCSKEGNDTYVLQRV